MSATASGPPQRFEQLLTARGADFERLRSAYFADAHAVAYLQTHFQDADAVRASVAVALHRWATQSHPEIGELEQFLRVGLYESKPRQERTAAGWQPLMEILKYMRTRPRSVIRDEHLLLRGWAAEKSGADPVYPATVSYFAEVPVTRPEVLIRATLEDKDPTVHDFMAERVLPLVDSQKVLTALQAEKAKAARRGIELPAPLLALENRVRTATAAGESGPLLKGPIGPFGD